MHNLGKVLEEDIHHPLRVNPIILVEARHSPDQEDREQGIHRPHQANPIIQMVKPNPEDLALDTHPQLQVNLTIHPQGAADQPMADLSALAKCLLE